MKISTTTDKLGLVQPSIDSEMHQTIRDLASNFGKIDDLAELYMSSPPETGEWAKNQKIWNENTDIGSVLGWINIREGVSAPSWNALRSYSLGDLITPTNN